MSDSFDIRMRLRRDAARKRNELSNAEVEAASKLIASRLADLKPLREAKAIMGFVSINNEVDISDFLNAQFIAGKTILLPRVEKNNDLAAVEFKGWENTKLGTFGIIEPQGEPWPADAIDAVLVPGLVFDGHGYRLGYGKGYYDTFLPRLKKSAFKCGVAYEFQVVDNIFPHSQDVPLHWLVTDQSELVFDWEYF